MNKSITSILALLVLCAAPATAVPSGINYQGALTDDQGNPITGTRTMSIKLYDAATGGTLLYSENIGTVDVSDGVFSFEFGTNGTSNAEQSDTVAITSGTAATFQKVLSAAEVVAGSVSVTDGTYTWTQASGSSNENDFGVAYSTSLRRLTVNYFNGAPAAGRTITATYRTPASGISGALAGDNQPWAEITVDDVAQVPRQKVLTVPFATRASVADSVRSVSPEVSVIIQDLSNLLQRVNMSGVALPSHFFDSTKSGFVAGVNGTIATNKPTATWDASSSAYVSTIPTNPVVTELVSSSSGGLGLQEEAKVYAYLSRISGSLSVSGQYAETPEIRFVYDDGTYHGIRQGSGSFNIANPNPSKGVRKLEFWGGVPNGYTGYSGSVTVNTLTLHPVPEQRRYIDVMLAGRGINAEFITLVTDAANTARHSFVVSSESWSSAELSSAQEHQLPSSMPLTSIRIFLNYDPTSPTFSGASLQGYSIKYR
jgi:hypothetical protein